jgi:hypothetical protein
VRFAATHGADDLVMLADEVEELIRVVDSADGGRLIGLHG